MTTTRRSFVTLLGSGLATVAAVSLWGCGDDGDDGSGGSGGSGASGGSTSSTTGSGGSSAGGGQPGACATNGTESTIGTNHGHTLTVPAQDVAAGVEQTYDITGTSTHPHMLTLTAADFAALQADQSITVTSSTDDAHAHEVTVQCAP